MQQASYLEGGPLMWMLPLYLQVNQKSDYDMMMMILSRAMTEFLMELRMASSNPSSGRKACSDN